MAEANLIHFTVNYQGNRTVLHLKKTEKVGTAIQKAAKQFKVPPEGLIFLYHGLEITDDMTVGDALDKANNVTVVHLICKVSKPGTATLKVAHREASGPVYAYCRECKSLATAREVFTCKQCKKQECFQRSSADPIDHFDLDSDNEVQGTCKCGGDTASVTYECTACEHGVRVAVLKQLRQNIHKVPCMKCGKGEEILFLFDCESRHCMCLQCFKYYCNQMLCAGGFRGFQDKGFSLGCPGQGPGCASTPVHDPHHFKIVDEDLLFYEKFIDMSVSVIDPEEDIMCICKTLIDTGPKNRVQVKVDEPYAEEQSSDGLRWYQRVFKRSQARSSAQRKREKVKCTNCPREYCYSCKQHWHEGDCLKDSDEAIKIEEKSFPIDRDKAAAGCWPQDSKEAGQD